MIIHPGELVRWNGEEHRIVTVRAAYVRLRPTDGEPDVEVLSSDLIAEAEPASARSMNDLLDMRTLDDLDSSERKAIDVWLEELDRLAQLLESGMKKTPAYEQIIANVNRRLGANYNAIKVPRQQQALAEKGVIGLLDRRRFGLADRQAPSHDPRLIEAVLNAMAGQTGKATGTQDRVIWMVREELDGRYGKGVVPMPSRATLYRLMDRLEAGRHTFGSARTRRTTANQPKNMHGKRVGLRPGEQVLIDTTPMEILVECDGEPVRPDLTILLDEASRSVPAAIVTVGTRSIDLIVILARALVPYAYRPEGVRANRRTVSQAWIGEDDLMAQRFEDVRESQPYIFPETITTDRGSSYVSQHFTDACRTLGISLTLAAQYTPTHKAKVERMFRTIKDLFTQYAVSFLGQSPDMKGDELIPVSQLLTLEQLQELLEDWIAGYWQNRPSSALRDPRNPRLKLSPNQMVNAFREVAPELHIPLTADRYIALLPTNWRAIHHYGVNIDHRVYDSEKLIGLRRTRSRHRNHQGQWPIHVDPYNPMTVWLEVDDEFIPLTWRSPYGGAPMAEEVWRIARAQAIARGDDEPDYDDLNDVMRRFMHTGNRLQTARERKRALSNRADLLGITNQIADNTADDSNHASRPDEAGSPAPEPLVAAKPWPVGPPLGYTRPPEG